MVLSNLDVDYTCSTIKYTLIDWSRESERTRERERAYTGTTHLI